MRSAAPWRWVPVAVAAAVALAAGPAGCGGRSSASTARADQPMIVAATHAAYADLEQQGARPDKSQTFKLRSVRNPEWALIDGFTIAQKPWAAWLRASDQVWSVEHIVVQRDHRRVSFTPPFRVPCDIETAFSQPACAPGRELSEFYSPSQNIGCIMRDGRAGCAANEYSFTPPPKPASCGLDWGRAVGVHNPGKGHFLCVGGLLAEPDSPTLKYGHSTSSGGITCLSSRAGIRCQNRAGHGFLLSGKQVQVY